MNTANETFIEVAGLPRRQGEVLLHTARGLTRKEAAKLMGCSPKNAEKLMDSVCYKLHARNSIQAVSIAFQRGILRTLALLLTISSVTVFLPAPAAQASDDDPMIRRVRARPTGRMTRRVRGSDHLADLMDPCCQDFIDFHCLQPVLVWDDGLYLTFQ